MTVTYKTQLLYVMKTKLTLRVDDTVIRKAKRIASKRGRSVSRIFSDYISEVEDSQEFNDINPITRSMIGALAGVEIENDRIEHHQHLEAKYL